MGKEKNGSGREASNMFPILEEPTGQFKFVRISNLI